VLTLQETVVSVAPVTVAEKFWVVPSRGAADCGVIVTVAAGGAGGETTATAAPALPLAPAQPAFHAAMARSARVGSDAERYGVAPCNSLRFFCERGRMLSEMQAKGQRGAAVS